MIVSIGERILCLRKANEISQEKLAELLLISRTKLSKIENDKEIILIDVRTRKEYEKGHIPNAILIELDKIEDIVDIISDKNKIIYLYC